MKENVGTTTRRGLFFIGFAKIWFLFAGFLLLLILPRCLEQAAFGVWTLVLAWVSGFNNVIITVTVQTVSYFSRMGREEAEQAKKTALKMQIYFGIGGMALLFFGAPLIARFERSDLLPFPLQIASFIVLFYSFYAIFVGAANGQQQFQKQASLDILFSILRVGFVFLGALLTHNVVYAILGFILAAACITLVSLYWIGWPKKVNAAPIPLMEMVRYGSWLLVYLLAFNQLMFIDLYLLKKICTDFFVHHFHLTSAQVGDYLEKPVYSLTAIYGAAQTIARLPYQLMIAVTFVIFPILSKKSREQNQEETRRYIAATLRYSLLGAGAMAIGLGARYAGTMTLFYPSAYASGSYALAFLLIAYVLFSLLSVVGTILNSLGHLRLTAIMCIFTLFITGVLVYFSLSQRMIAPESLAQVQEHVQPLSLAAQGLLAGFGLGLVLFLMVLWMKYKVTFSFLSLFRVGFACLPGFFLGWFFQSSYLPARFAGKIGTLLCGIASGVSYLVLLLLTRELSFSEILNLRKNHSSEADNGRLAD